jgi:hypothetical protein
MIRSLSWHEFIHKADLAITLGILKTTVSSVVRTTLNIVDVVCTNAAGCTKCATFWNMCASAIMTK